MGDDAPLEEFSAMTVDDLFNVVIADGQGIETRTAPIDQSNYPDFNYEGMEKQEAGWYGMARAVGDQMWTLDTNIRGARGSWHSTAGEVYFEKTEEVRDSMEKARDNAYDNATAWSSMASAAAQGYYGVIFAKTDWDQKKKELRQQYEEDKKDDNWAKGLIGQNAEEPDYEAARRPYDERARQAVSQASRTIQQINREQVVFPGVYTPPEDPGPTPDPGGWGGPGGPAAPGAPGGPGGPGAPAHPGSPGPGPDLQGPGAPPIAPPPPAPGPVAPAPPGPGPGTPPMPLPRAPMPPTPPPPRMPAPPPRPPGPSPRPPGPAPRPPAPPPRPPGPTPRPPAPPPRTPMPPPRSPGLPGPGQPPPGRTPVPPPGGRTPTPPPTSPRPPGPTTKPIIGGRPGGPGNFGRSRTAPPVRGIQPPVIGGRPGATPGATPPRAGMPGGAPRGGMPRTAPGVPSAFGRQNAAPTSGGRAPSGAPGVRGMTPPSRAIANNGVIGSRQSQAAARSGAGGTQPQAPGVRAAKVKSGGEHLNRGVIRGAKHGVAPAKAHGDTAYGQRPGRGGVLKVEDEDGVESTYEEEVFTVDQKVVPGVIRGHKAPKAAADGRDRRPAFDDDDW